MYWVVAMYADTKRWNERFVLGKLDLRAAALSVSVKCVCIYIYIWIIYINFKTPEYDTNVWTIYINFKCVWQYPQYMYTQSWCFTARQRRSQPLFSRRARPEMQTMTIYFTARQRRSHYIFRGAPEQQRPQQHTQIHTHANIAIVYHSWHFDNHLSTVHRNIFLVFWYVFIQSCIFRSRAVGVKHPP